MGKATRTVKNPPFFYISYGLQFLAAFCAYYFAARFALDVGAINTFAAPLWPPTGIALAAIYFGGTRLFPAIGLAAFAVNYAIGAPVVAALAIACGNTAEAVLGVYLLHNLRFRPFFDRMGDSIGFIAVALSVPFVSAIIGPVALVASHAIAPSLLPQTSFTWWIGDVLGALIVAPFLIKWFARPISQVQRGFLGWIENILFFSVLATVSILVFWDPVPALHTFVSPYQVFIPLTWGALRVGPRFLIAGFLMLAAIASLGTIQGSGPFSGSNDSLFLLQLFLGAGSTIFLLFVAAIEERKRATQELRAHVINLQEDVEEISEADQAKNDFIAILSHELRNPLAPVLSSLELMRMQADRMPHFREPIESMQVQIKRITRLLDDLLDITRIARKKFDLRMEHVRLQEVIDHSLTTVAEAARQRAQVLTHMIAEEPIWVEGDPFRLEQVIVNILNNAIKYTPRGGAIHVALSAEETPEGPRARIRIRDTGRGIPPDMLTAIFEPFKQAGQGHESSAGLGIGLSLAKRFVELHQGSIMAESMGKGRGSEFTVTLPIKEVQLLQAPHEETTVRQEPPARKPKRTVLIIDDNEAAARGVAQLLTHSGHTVRTAHDGAGALAALSDFRPDIIFLDIGLPDMTGYDLARTIRQYLNPSPILVAHTGFGQEEDQRRAQEAGFDAHLTKPVSIADLEKILLR